MSTLILTIHIIACIFLVVMVLLQSGHEGMGAIFGGGSTTMFGASGAGGLLVKVTAGLAALFLFTSLTYNILTSAGSSTGITEELTKAAQTAPAETPAAPEGVDTGATAPAPATEDQQ